MNTEKILPICWESWDQGGDYGEIMFYRVVFIEDFGPFKQHELVDCLFYSPQQAVVKELLDNIDGRIASVRLIAE